jgi:hypothetical protein
VDTRDKPEYDGGQKKPFPPLFVMRYESANFRAKFRLQEIRIHASVFLRSILPPEPRGDFGERCFMPYPTPKIFGNDKKRSCAPRIPLKRLKTAKKMFLKAWRFQAINLEKLAKNLTKSLEKLAEIYVPGQSFSARSIAWLKPVSE